MGISYKIIIDTNVIVSGLRSRLGASFQLLSMIKDERIQLFVSNSIIFEYEEILKQKKDMIHLELEEIDALLDDICSIATDKNIYYLWRPTLSDADDDMFVDLAVSANIDYIITFNISNFVKAKKLGIKVITPQEFLRLLGEIK